MLNSEKIVRAYSATPQNQDDEENPLRFATEVKRNK